MFGKKKKQDGATDYTNPAGVDFDSNSVEDVNHEGEAHNVAERRGSNAAKKGFFLICGGLVLVLLLGMGYRAKIKSDSKEQAKAAQTVADSKPAKTPAFALPEEKAASDTMPPPPDIQASGVQPDIQVGGDFDSGQETAPPEPPPPAWESAQMMVADNGKSILSGGADGENSADGAVSSGAPLPAALSALDADGGKSGSGNPLADSLKATVTPSATANRFANRNLLLAKGTMIQCSLKTRLETQIAGMLACTTLKDVYSDNKKVLLLERGSLIEGEYQNAAEMGATRIFVLWTRIRTPNGIVVNLDSPATDTLGGAGVNGHVNHHFWRRFSNAIMFSLIQDGISTGLQRMEKHSSAQTIVYENTEKTTDDIINDILKSTANIPPTIYKNQGDNAAVFVARDIDFSSVYSLRPRMPVAGSLNGSTSIRQ